MSYNGWSNRETWAVALWIDNEEGSYNYRQELALDFIAPEVADDWSEDSDFYEEVDPTAPGEHHVDEEGTHKVRVHNVSGYADAIQSFVEGDMMPDLRASLASDLMSYALSEVNWREIAEHWLSESD